MASVKNKSMPYRTKTHSWTVSLIHRLLLGKIPKYLLITVFIRLSAQGAYLIFGLSGWALIRGGRLFEAGRLLNFHHFQ